MLTVSMQELTTADMHITHIKGTDMSAVPDLSLDMRDAARKLLLATLLPTFLAFTGNYFIQPIRRWTPCSLAVSAVQYCESPSQQTPAVACRATVQSVRPFGVFVALLGYKRHGMVHSSQVAEELSFSREDEDEMKVKAMEFYAPSGSEVTTTR